MSPSCADLSLDWFRASTFSLKHKTGVAATSAAMPGKSGQFPRDVRLAGSDALPGRPRFKGWEPAPDHAAAGHRRGAAAGRGLCPVLVRPDADLGHDEFHQFR